MTILQGAIHVFGKRIDLVTRAFQRELEYQAQNKAPWEVIPQSTIIQYPNAISFFCNLSLSYEYIAQMYSQKMKAPVLVSIVGKKPTLGETICETIQLFWGIDSRCVSRLIYVIDWRNKRLESEGLDILKEKLDWLIPTNSVLFSSLEDITPSNMAFVLSHELGVFLGGVELDSFLRKCVLKRKYELGCLYKNTNYDTGTVYLNQ